MRPQPTDSDGFYHWADAGWDNSAPFVPVLPGHSLAVGCPYGQVGDRLWVREAFQIVEPSGSVGDEWIGDDIREIDGPLPKDKPASIPNWWSILYRADDENVCSWRPSIFMPRWASRITLEIVGVRVERVQYISAEDALAEGVAHTAHWRPTNVASKPFEDKWWDDFYFWTHYPQIAYQGLWDSINARRGYGWYMNPWVWVIEFKRVEDES